MPLAEKRVMIIGATSEAGSAVALACAEAGADLAVASAVPDADDAFAMQRLARRIRDKGRTALSQAVDTSLGTNVQVAVRQVVKELGGLDLMIVAPDWRQARPAERMTDVEWSRAIAYNLNGVFYACRAAAREMLAQEPDETGVRGRIVVLLPRVDEALLEQESAYLAARGGIEAFMRAVQREWGERGVSAHTIVYSDAQQAADEVLVEGGR